MEMIFLRIKHFPLWGKKGKSYKKSTVLDRALITAFGLTQSFGISVTGHLHSATKFKCHFVPIHRHVLCSRFWDLRQEKRPKTPVLKTHYYSQPAGVTNNTQWRRALGFAGRDAGDKALSVLRKVGLRPPLQSRGKQRVDLHCPVTRIAGTGKEQRVEGMLLGTDYFLGLSTAALSGDLQGTTCHWIPFTRNVFNRQIRQHRK